MHLASITLEYVEKIYKEFTEEITEFMNPVPAKDIHETEEFIMKSRKKMSEGKELVCVVLENETGEFLGCAGLHDIDTPMPELGIWIKRSAHGHGYGREAVQALKSWADEHFNYDYLRYPVAAANIASRKVAESLGGVVVKEYMETTMSGRTLPYVDYKIKIEE